MSTAPPLPILPHFTRGEGPRQILLTTKTADDMVFWFTDTGLAALNLNSLRRDDDAAHN